MPVAAIHAGLKRTFLYIFMTVQADNVLQDFYEFLGDGLKYYVTLLYTS